MPRTISLALPLLLTILPAVVVVAVDPTPPAPPPLSAPFSLGYCLYVLEKNPRPSLAEQQRLADIRRLIARLRGEDNAKKGYEEARADAEADTENDRACTHYCAQKLGANRIHLDCYDACMAKAKTYTGSERRAMCSSDTWWTVMLGIGGLPR